MTEEKVLDKSLTGRPKEILSEIIRVVSASTRRGIASGFKIGITNNPERRYKKHEKNYDKMILVYRSSSIDNVSELECNLIEYYGERADNKKAGGGGDIGDKPYYTYIVIKYL